MPIDFSKKREKHLFKRCGPLFLIVAWLFCFFPGALTGKETAKTPASGQEAPVEKAPASAKDAPCQGLKPINNLDELLYQFYINLESDCLFNMTPTELEKIWGIKILSHERAIPKPGEYLKLKEGVEFYDKPYKSAEDAFYVEAHKDYNGNWPIKSFYINITKAYYEQKGRLFFASKPPESLPPPVVEGDMIKGHYLTWFNTDKTRMISCRYNSPRGRAGITSISIRHTVNPERFKEGVK